MSVVSLDLLKSIVVFLDWCEKDDIINNIGINGILLNEKEKKEITTHWKKYTKNTKIITRSIIIYYVNGKIHRDDGPAVTWRDASRVEWWRNDIRTRVENM